MATAPAGTSMELGTLRGRLAAAIAVGASAGTLWGEVISIVDVLERAMQTTHRLMQKVELRQTEIERMIGLRDGSIAERHSAMDNSSMQNIGQFGGDKSIFKTCNDEVMSAFARAEASSRVVFDAMRKHVDRGVEEAFIIQQNAEWFALKVLTA